MLYNIEFPYGAVKQSSVKVIARNIYSQVDQDVFSQTLPKSIIYYSKDGHSVTNDNMYVTTKANHTKLYQTTIFWKLLVKLIYGSEQLVSFNILK